MGDVAMVVPVLNNLLLQYPDLKITFVTRKFFAPMFSSMERVSVFEADVNGKHKGLLGLWRLYRALKKEQPDAIADLHKVLRSAILKFFFSFTSIPVRQINKGRQEKKSLTSLKKKVFEPLKSTHQRYADVFRDLGYPLELDTSKVLPKRGLSKKVLELTGDHERKWVGIAPFTAYEGKMYPLELMKTVIKELNNTNGYKIFLFGGGKAEVNTLNAIEGEYRGAKNIAGKLNFEEELSLISHLDVMLAMDSGNGHLAAMFGVPTVTLWGITHPHAGFSPFGQPTEYALLSDREQFPAIPTSVYGNKYPQGYESAMSSIAPETVVQKMIEVLQKQSGKMNKK
ncbi:glycosyltransferase family 9 protein [Muriicola sp. Z0-33]|nr:glycosyltransferase family 9 protein [Muriicola sp. Z0-33]